MAEKRESASDSARPAWRDAEAYLLLRRRVFFHGDVTERSCRELIFKLSALDERGRGRVTLSIVSDGGVVPDAFAVIDVMEEMRSPITTVGRGCVSSAALLIFMAGSRRRLSRRASVLSHEPEAAEWGRSEDREAAREDNLRMEARFVEHYVRYTRLSTPAEVKEFLLPGHDVYLTPEDALSLGLCDELMDEPPKRRALRRRDKAFEKWLAEKRRGAKAKR